ncbi:MAG: hypothetical protein KC550_03160 [Nanoarchaeota archaeon]|nr:hypothetical protein [Nanoarchaeota archaeon]
MADKNPQDVKKSFTGQDNLEYKSLERESLTDKPQQPNKINAEPQVRVQDKPSVNTDTD